MINKLLLKLSAYIPIIARWLIQREAKKLADRVLPIAFSKIDPLLRDMLRDVTKSDIESKLESVINREGVKKDVKDLVIEKFHKKLDIRKILN